MRKILLGLSMLGVVAAVSHSVKAEEAKKAAASQNWYMIESKHTQQECLKALDDMNANNLLGKTYFGCKSGDHRGWTMLQAPSNEAALNMIPASQRADAKVVQVGQFTPEQLKAIHSQHT